MDWDSKFNGFLRRENTYVKAPAVLLTSTSDDERERGVIHTSMRNYYGNDFNFKNKSTIAYDPEKLELSGVKIGGTRRGGPARRGARCQYTWKHTLALRQSPRH